MSTLIPSLPLVHAALIPIGCGPFIAMLLSILVVGFIAYVANWAVAYLPVSDPMKAIVLKIIYVASVVYVVLLVVDFVFGINLFGVRPIPVCG